jgi:hypothetical protein
MGTCVSPDHCFSPVFSLFVFPPGILYGNLMTTVAEGPEKIASVFLTRRSHSERAQVRPNALENMILFSSIIMQSLTLLCVSLFQAPAGRARVGRSSPRGDSPAPRPGGHRGSLMLGKLAKVRHTQTDTQRERDSCCVVCSDISLTCPQNGTSTWSNPLFGLKLSTISPASSPRGSPRPSPRLTTVRPNAHINTPSVTCVVDMKHIHLMTSIYSIHLFNPFIQSIYSIHPSHDIS